MYSLLSELIRIH